MIKPAARHVRSLGRAITILQISANRQKVPKYRKELELDIQHLEQVKELVEGYLIAPMFDHIIDVACELSI